MAETYDFLTWIEAWRAEMAKRGWPAAFLYCDHTLLEELTYGWMGDANSTWSNVEVDEAVYSRQWDDAHAAFLAVDSLRPPTVKPSPILREMLERHDG